MTSRQGRWRDVSRSFLMMQQLGASQDNRAPYRGDRREPDQLVTTSTKPSMTLKRRSKKKLTPCARAFAPA